MLFKHSDYRAHEQGVVAELITVTTRDHTLFQFKSGTWDLRNSYLLLKIKEKLLDTIPESKQSILKGIQFTKLIHETFPLKTSGGKGNDDTEDEVIEALEVQHYQSLIHRNRKILFPNYKDYDED